MDNENEMYGGGKYKSTRNRATTTKLSFLGGGTIAMTMRGNVKAGARADGMIVSMNQSRKCGHGPRAVGELRRGVTQAGPFGTVGDLPHGGMRTRRMRMTSPRNGQAPLEQVGMVTTARVRTHCPRALPRTCVALIAR